MSPIGWVLLIAGVALMGWSASVFLRTAKPKRPKL